MNEPVKPRPAFNREAVFAEVSASNRRFENYTKAQRKAFYKLGKWLIQSKPGTETL